MTDMLTLLLKILCNATPQISTKKEQNYKGNKGNMSTYI